MLEYRGYDSAGLVCVSSDKEVFLEKAVGRVSQLASKVDKRMEESREGVSKVESRERRSAFPTETKQTEHMSVFTTGIAHTRWATH